MRTMELPYKYFFNQIEKKFKTPHFFECLL
jgi:hypothetical protein